MSNKITEEWRTYKKSIEEAQRLHAQVELFPGRTSSKEKLKEVRTKLFNDYEGFLNSNNPINKHVLETTIKDWFSKNCRVQKSFEVADWIEEQEFESPIVRYIAEQNIGANMCDLCFKGGTPRCPQTRTDEKGCASKLLKEIIKSSEGYTSVPNTEKNFDTFLNSSTQYLDKDSHTQESSDSPIEDIMFDALKQVAKKHQLRIQREYPVYDEGRLEIRYSLDILFLDEGTNMPVLDIETDGLTYHSGYQNMANDRARDRWLLIRGIPTMRFTSREVFNDLNNCVIQVDSALETLCGRNRKKKKKR